MFGLLNLFGRSAALKALDDALRHNGLHQLVVPEAVKITIVRLLKEEARAGTGPREAAYGEAAQLLAYCMLGRDQSIASNSIEAADEAEEVAAAREAGEADGAGDTSENETGEDEADGQD